MIEAKLKNKTVMIIDDNRIDRTVLRSCCQKLGLNIVALEGSAYAALSKLDTMAHNHVIPDLMLIDIMLYGMDGNMLAEEIALDLRFSKIKLIAVSSDLEAAKLKSQGGHFDAFHPKPVMPQTLQTLIMKTLQMS